MRINAKTLLRYCVSEFRISRRLFSVANNSSVSSRKYGQPTEWTHPHIIGKNEVNKGIQKSEFRQRRENLVERLLKQKSGGSNLLIIPAARKQFMIDKIPSSSDKTQTSDTSLAAFNRTMYSF